MKRKLYIIGSLTIAAVIILFTLNAATDKPNNAKNGFTRSFYKTDVREIKRIDIDIAVDGIAGVNGDSIFIKTAKPGLVYLFTNQLEKIDTFHIPALDSITNLFTSFYTFIDFPQFTLIGGNSQNIIKGDWKTRNYHVADIDLGGVFTDVIQLDSNTYVMNVIDRNTLNASFKKWNSASGLITEENRISVPLADAGFTFAGALNYDRATNRFIAVPIFNNNVFCFDTTLNVVYRSHTIDTTFTPRVTSRAKGKAVTNEHPPVSINKNSWLAGSYFYVKSALRADNEEPSVFERNDAVDGYRIKDGTYLGSYYLPKLKGKKAGQYVMLDSGKMLVIYEHTLVLYDINS